MLNLKKPPHNLEAEQSVLGSILMEESNVAKAEEMLSTEDFYATGNGEIFSAMVSLHNASKPIDLLTLTDQLERDDILEEVGGKEYILEIISQVPTFKNIEEYCRIVQENALRRKLIDTASEIIDNSFEYKDNVERLIENAERHIYEVSQGKKKGDFEKISETLVETIGQIEKIAENPGELTGLTTGFTEVDFMTSGLQKSDLIFLAARPSMGKTAFALNLAHNAAKTGSKVAIFSLEMSKAQLVQRMLCADARVDSSHVRKGDLSLEEWDELSKAYKRLYELNIFIDDTPAITLSEIRSKCRRLRSEHGLDFILIDYLQLMGSQGRSENRQNEVSEISKGLKGLARELDCPIVCLAQLSRAPEGRQDHHPMLSDLRESGSMEQDADMVLLLFREYYYNKEALPNVAELDIAKQRNGPTGRVRLAWLPEFTQFMDLEEDYIPPEGA